MDRVDPEASLRMATEIVVAYLGKTTVEPDRLATLVREVRNALEAESSAFAVGQRVAATESTMKAESAPASQIAPKPAVRPEDSITDEFIYSLEDGRPYRSLRRHLMAQYGLTPEQYREKWGLPSDYPMVAPSYAADRAAVAKRIGLGRRTGKAAGPAKSAKASLATRPAARRTKAKATP